MAIDLETSRRNKSEIWFRSPILSHPSPFHPTPHRNTHETWVEIDTEKRQLEKERERERDDHAKIINEKRNTWEMRHLYTQSTHSEYFRWYCVLIEACAWLVVSYNVTCENENDCSWIDSETEAVVSRVEGTRTMLEQRAYFRRIFGLGTLESGLNTRALSHMTANMCDVIMMSWS